MAALYFDLSEQFLANGHRFKYYGIVRTVMEVGYELAKSGQDVRFVIYSPAHEQFFEVTPRLDAASPTGLMDPGLPPGATPIRLRQSFPTRNLLRDGLMALARPLARRINRRRWRHVPDGVARPVDLNGQVLIALGRPKIIADYLVHAERNGTQLHLVPLLHDMIPLHAFAHRDQKIFTSHFMHDNRRVIRHAALLMANSEFTRQEIILFGDKIRIPDMPPVETVPLSHELRTTGEAAEMTPPAAPYVMCVGTLTGRKNLECVMDALLNLAEQGRPVPDLVLAGARRKRAESYVDDNRFAAIRDKVHFYRDPNQTDLKALYQGALALIIPSYMEGWGLPLGEALWVGTPGLSSTAPALQEVGGDLAAYFDPADPAALAQLIDGLQSDAKACAALKARIKTARPGLRSWQDVAEDVLTAGHKVVNGKTSSRKISP
jgi:glycosyltransferase involved in cell wall biosynthesis